VTFNFDGSVVPGCGSSCNNIAVHDCLSSAGQSGSAIWSGSGSNRTVRYPKRVAFSHCEDWSAPRL